MSTIALLIDGGYMANLLKKYLGEPRIDYALFAQWACKPNSMLGVYYYDWLLSFTITGLTRSA